MFSRSYVRNAYRKVDFFQKFDYLIDSIIKLLLDFCEPLHY